jgi:hypothetical protein
VEGLAARRDQKSRTDPCGQGTLTRRRGAHHIRPCGKCGLDKSIDLLCIARHWKKDWPRRACVERHSSFQRLIGSLAQWRFYRDCWRRSPTSASQFFLKMRAPQAVSFGAALLSLQNLRLELTEAPAESPGCRRHR